MIRDGKSLEYLVSQIEQLLLPQGFTVKSNERVYNDDGEQIAEFDVQITGKLGSTDMAWLIECRDRPSAGPAPGSWIEQLAGRRDRFGLNKVTAVSSTGFSSSAQHAAERLGIELRIVTNLSVDDIADWMRMKGMTQHIQYVNLQDIQFNLSQNEQPALLTALRDILQKQSGDPRILKSISTGQLATASEAFRAAAETLGDPFEGLEENGLGRALQFRAQYPNDNDHFVIDTAEGPVRIREIAFRGEFSVKTKFLPFAEVKDYRGVAGESISKSATVPFEINHEPYEVVFHRLAKTGETRVQVRKLETEPPSESGCEES